MKKSLSLLPKIATLFAATAFVAPAMAQTAGSNIVGLGWFHFMPQDSSEPLRVVSPTPTTLAGSGASVGNADTLGVAFTHFFSDNFALTADVGVPPKFTIKGTGTLGSVGDIGKAKQWSPALVAKWFFGDGNSKFRPFVGAGASYVWYSNVELTNQFQTTVSSTLTGGATTAARSTADLSSSWAPVLNAGAVYNIDKNWSVGLSVSYLSLKTNADITTTTPLGTQIKSATSVTLNPIVTFLSVGYKF